MIRIENLSKSYGGQILFEGVNFKINSRERVGLVGRNGYGKTTLLRLITGKEQPDQGVVVVPKHYRIGYVQQHIAFKEDTVLQEGARGLPANEKDHYWKVEKILAGLGFSENDFKRHPGEFSGGFQVRLNLAKVMISEPDLLLLDEPTNYLDITSIRWVQRFLSSWPHEVLLITHDRGFMDKLVTHIVGIHRHNMRKIKGNTEKYYAQIAQDEEVYEKTRANDERRRKEIELFISRFRAKARLANMVQSRVKTLSKLEKKDRLLTLKTLDFSFKSYPFTGKIMMTAEGISFGYQPERPLIDNFSLTVGQKDRICVIGKNGKGKTTLLKALSGVLPLQKGDISLHHNVRRGFFEQTNIQSLVDERTVEEEILYSDEAVDRQMARNVCGAMMFEGDAALKKIAVLSGGEKSRVMLGKVLVTPVNLLLLDEPTNHLDMESCDALLAAIDAFEGAVVMVTHNEMLLHALAKRLVVFQDDGVQIFEGSYQRFLASGGWMDEETPSFDSSQEDVEGFEKDAESAAKLNKKELRRLRSEVITQRSKELKPLEQKIARIEDDIEKHENELNGYNDDMQQATEVQDGNRIAQLGKKINQCQAEIDALFEALEQLMEQLEVRQEVYEEKLAALQVDENRL